MLRPNYEETFYLVAQKICDNNQSILNNFASQGQNLTSQIKYAPFVAIQISNSLINSSTDWQSMNTNLDYLLNKWHL